MRTIIIILISGIAGCLLIFNIRLFHINRQNKVVIETLTKELDRIGYLLEFEYLYKASKELNIFILRNEQYPLKNYEIYIGADKNKVIPIETLIDKPKLIFGSSQNMCSPCIYSVLDKLKEVFPDYIENENILFVADIEQRLKDNYHHKKVVSFENEEDFPLYKSGMPYFFILDEDMMIKMLFITDKVSPDLTKEYLTLIKERFINL
jgi:hypothetical protein